MICRAFSSEEEDSSCPLFMQNYKLPATFFFAYPYCGIILQPILVYNRLCVCVCFTVYMFRCDVKLFNGQLINHIHSNSIKTQQHLNACYTHTHTNNISREFASSLSVLEYRILLKLTKELNVCDKKQYGFLNNRFLLSRSIAHNV